MIKINPNMKFSYALIKGSPAKRESIIKDINDRLVESMVPHLEDKSFDFQQLKKVYMSVLPEKKNIKFIRLHNDKYDGQTSYLYDRRNNVIGQTLELEMGKSVEPNNYFIALIHENSHIIDALVNPKKTARAQYCMKETNLSSKTYNYIYDNLLYTQEDYTNTTEMVERLKDIRKAIAEKLKKKKCCDKIAILNDMRYDLESEKIAYAEQLRIAKLLESMHIKVSPTDLEDCDRIYWFTEKIQILKSLIYEFITQERKKIATKAAAKASIIESGKLQK